jgi:hypothetical protein
MQNIFHPNKFEKFDERGQKYLITVYLAITLLRSTAIAHNADNYMQYGIRGDFLSGCKNVEARTKVRKPELPVLNIVEVCVSGLLLKHDKNHKKYLKISTILFGSS